MSDSRLLGQSVHQELDEAERLSQKVEELTAHGDHAGALAAARAMARHDREAIKLLHESDQFLHEDIERQKQEERERLRTLRETDEKAGK